jgi:hypothetical protein
MAIVYSHLTVSLTNENPNLTLEMIQGDTGRGLIVFASDDVIVDESSEPDSSLTATLWIEKPSGLNVSVDATSVTQFENSNAYEITFSDTETFANILAEVGVVNAEIVLSSDNTFVTSFSFKIKVVKNFALDSGIDSTEDFKNLLDAIAKAKTTVKTLEGYQKQLDNQLKLTVNVRSGTTDPTVQATDKAGDIYIKYEG